MEDTNNDCITFDWTSEKKAERPVLRRGQHREEGRTARIRKKALPGRSCQYHKSMNWKNLGAEIIQNLGAEILLWRNPGADC